MVRILKIYTSEKLTSLFKVVLSKLKGDDYVGLRYSAYRGGSVAVYGTGTRSDRPADHRSIAPLPLRLGGVPWHGR